MHQNAASTLSADPYCPQTPGRSRRRRRVWGGEGELPRWTSVGGIFRKRASPLCRASPRKSHAIIRRSSPGGTNASLGELAPGISLKRLAEHPAHDVSRRYRGRQALIRVLLNSHWSFKGAVPFAWILS